MASTQDSVEPLSKGATDIFWRHIGGWSTLVGLANSTSNLDTRTRPSATTTTTSSSLHGLTAIPATWTLRLRRSGSENEYAVYSFSRVFEKFGDAGRFVGIFKGLLTRTLTDPFSWSTYKTSLCWQACTLTKGDVAFSNTISPTVQSTSRSTIKMTLLNTRNTWFLWIGENTTWRHSLSGIMLSSLEVETIDYVVGWVSRSSAKCTY